MWCRLRPSLVESWKFVQRSEVANCASPARCFSFSAIAPIVASWRQQRPKLWKRQNQQTHALNEKEKNRLTSTSALNVCGCYAPVLHFWFPVAFQQPGHSKWLLLLRHSLQSRIDLSSNNNTNNSVSHLWDSCLVNISWSLPSCFTVQVSHVTFISIVAKKKYSRTVYLAAQLKNKYFP